MNKKVNFSSLSIRIPLLVGVLILVALTITSTISIYKAKSTIITDAMDQIMSEADAHAEMITIYLRDRVGDIQLMAKHPYIVNSSVGQQEKNQALEVLKNGYGSTYQNIVLVRPDGSVIASAGQNISADYSGEKWLKQTLDKNDVYYQYHPGKEPDSHFVTFSYPVRDEKSQLVGVVTAAMSFKMINDALDGIIRDYESDGILGSYPYILDSEGALIWHPKKEKVVNRENLAQRDDALGKIAQNMIQGKRDYSEYIYEQVPKIVGYAPLDKGGLNWSLAITLTQVELMEPVKETTAYLIGAGLIIFILILGIVYFVINLSLKPLSQAINMLRDIAEGKGDLTQRITMNSKNEVGILAGYFNMFIEKVQNIIRDIYDNTVILNGASSNLLTVAETMTATSEEMNAKTTAVSSTVEEISASMSNTAATVSGSSDNMNVIATAVEEMSATIRNLASASEQTSVGVGQTTGLVGQISDSINGVSISARDVSQSVSSVATAVKEINISLNEVSRNCERSIHITSDAESKSKDTNSIIEKLNITSKQIGKIIDVINDIADQTNMLALNAAIEAAGAGEAGKGFAVVANEVKELAKQTAEATEEISQQIERMQTDMTQAVKATDAITEVIKEITHITNTIAAAVTEQSATTGEISTAVVKAAEKVNFITQEIGEVAHNAQNVTRSISEASKGVNEIARSASELSVASNDVAQNTERASEKIRDVARASREVSNATDEITENIVEISSASEDTASGATDASKAAHELSEISQKLEILVKQFKI